VDQERGIVFMPFGAPSFDRYGGDHHGANLFANALVAADANTGKYLWHFQINHHEIWDWDLSAPATLLTLTVSNRLGIRTRLLAQAEGRSLGLANVRQVLLRVGQTMLACQGVIAVVLAARFYFGYDYGLGRSIWYGVFHAVSAFNNAGFALFSDSLIGFVGDWWICIPLTLGVIAGSVGFPVLFKAENGGGGRGMRIARSAADVDTAYAEAQAEARAAFGGDRVYLEKLVEGGRHVEIQIFADRYRRAVHLGERDCTVQRNHQKLIEESPSPAIGGDLRARACAAAARAAATVGYVGAGTMELLLDEGVLRFMEMNCRLQVEHTVSEERSGKDLVIAQIEVAAGRPLTWQQGELVLDGHVIECRINAEDPANGFAPAPGTITAWQPPSGDGIRVDTHVTAGYVVPPFYDSLIAKLIVRAADRDAAIAKMIAALSAFEVAGVPTTIPMHLAILRSEAFRTSRYDTRSIPGWPPAVG